MNRGVSFIGAMLALAIPLVGCGGGGGGSKSSSGTGVLALSLSGDAGSASGPIGTAHHIVVYRSDGSVVDEKTVDLSSGTKQVTLKNLPSGTLHLHLGLLTSSSASEVGAIDTTFQGGTAATPIEVAMAQPVTSVTLSPVSATVNVGSTTPLYAAARANDGRYVYTATDGWNWSSANPASATVDASGTVTGVAEGSADVTATHVASGVFAKSTVGVLGTGIRHGKWTVMVFMNAANSLYQEALDNVNQMEMVANNPDVRFIVQWKQTADTGQAPGQSWSGTRRYLAAYDASSSAVKSTLVEDLRNTVDMGSPDALSGFVDWTKANYPADHYALVVWDHGSGWYYPTRAMKVQTRGISLDESTGSILSTQDVGNALAGRHVDILAYDACLMQSAEMLFQTASSADYIAASEDNTPAPGYPYDKVFKPFVDTPDAPVSDLAKNFVTKFYDRYGGSGFASWAIQESVIDTSKTAALRTALDNFGLALIDKKATLGTLMGDVRSASGATDSSGPVPAYEWLYYDLDQVCQNTISKTTDVTVSAAASAVRSALADMTVASSSNARGAFLHGLSIEFSKASRFNATYASSYSGLQIASSTHWDEFLKDATANP